MKKLRLLLFEECNRSCEGCCNKDWDLKVLPQITNFQGYDEILLTGGEPLLRPDIVTATAKSIREQNPKARIFLYTAKVDDWMCVLEIIGDIDGLTVTLHDKIDIPPFVRLTTFLPTMLSQSLSLRLNIFKGVFPEANVPYWKIKNNIKWIKNCPLPKDEIFGRI